MAGIIVVFILMVRTSNRLHGRACKDRPRTSDSDFTADSTNLARIPHRHITAIRSAIGKAYAIEGNLVRPVDTVTALRPFSMMAGDPLTIEVVLDALLELGEEIDTEKVAAIMEDLSDMAAIGVYSRTTVEEVIVHLSNSLDRHLPHTADPVDDGPRTCDPSTDD